MVVAVFQEGIGASLIGADSGVPVISFLPVMLFAILFGLSMDYNVFLLSRIHEAYNQGDGPRESVIHGMGRIGKVVVFAGLIMAAVFLSFVMQDDLIGKMFGLGLGLAILIDVLVVRMVIAPAMVTLLGDRAWWLPAWMDRALPHVSLDEPRRSAGTDAEPAGAGGAIAVEGLALEVERSPRRVTVRATGDVDLSTVGRLHDTLLGVEQDAGTVIVDLRGVRFIDSSGLAALVAAHQRARRRGARFVAVRTDATPVAQILAHTALDRAFETAERPPG